MYGRPARLPLEVGKQCYATDRADRRFQKIDPATSRIDADGSTPTPPSTTTINSPATEIPSSSNTLKPPLTIDIN